MTENIQIPSWKKNIVFIGFMGAGKTTIGQLVAKKLHRDFIDIDLEIENKYGMPVPEIFRKFGESRFRQLEKELILDTCTNTCLKVISLGGGAYLQEEVREVCLNRCIVCFLDLSWEAFKNRLPFIVDTRPVLQNKSLAEIKELFRKRSAAYSMHHLRIGIDDLDFEKSADQVVELLHIGASLHQPQD
ncbi:shikimate kinase [Thermoactinomyces mirandus]|uniref:Shikimate kinase n=1 Tax=Thermoactinomyces mirandus TaxID=2756294 RepID=A0A7W2AS65_9BACL|nr:shikimate kinase [Thermoactinomyces mirandus]MBA4602136.1 shikimate kinase [Thermoactinomyces mirandus]